MAADDDNGDGTGLFDVCPASPLKNNDEGSLDIYAGLDSAVSDSTARSCVTFRNCLDLYEEILTEEGTAKEATYNDLQVEYGKCQLQMRELMEKFKEIQTQNLNLKNENQSLKKNISALIKTARVEINRKDEEINHLHQRLSEFPHFRNNHKTARTKDPRPRSPHLDGCSKTDHRVQSDVHKDVHPNTSQPSLEKEEKPHSEAQNPPHLPTGIEKRTNSVWSRSHHQVGEGNSNEDNRRERNSVRHSQSSRGTDRPQKDLSNSCSDGEPRDKESNSRLPGNPERRGNSDTRAESKSSEMKSSSGLGHKSERSASSREKETSRERPHTRVESQKDKNSERQNERLQNVHRKDLQPQDRADRKADMKPKPAGEDQGHRGRVERASPSHSKNETKSHGFSKYHPEERRGKEDCKRDRGVSSHGFQDRRCSSSPSSNRNSKYVHSKEVSVAHPWEKTSFKAERHRTEDRRKRERENKEENRHVKNDKKSPAEHLQRTNKEAQKSTADVKRQTEPRTGKGGVCGNAASKGTGHKECVVVKGETGPSEVKSKDLKLSFMEKLNLTLSPAKKQPACQDNQLQITDVPKSPGVCESQSSEKTKTVACVPSVSERSTEETKLELLEPKETFPAASQLRVSIPENKMEEENRLLVKSVERTVPCEMLVCGSESSFPAPAEVEQTRPLFPLVKAGETTSVARTVLPGRTSGNLGQTLDTKRQDGLTCGIPESLGMKVAVSSKAAATSASLLQPLGEEPGVSLVNCSGNNNPKLESSLADIPMVENKSCYSEPCLPKETFVPSPEKTELIDHKIETGESNSIYQDDDNSVLSIDFNHLRPIPEAISPLNSPVRPVAKILRMESPCAVPLYDGRRDEFPSNSTHSTFKNQSDLNKENKKPVPKFDKCSEANSCKKLSSEDLEEGEIRSDGEESIAQKSLGKSSRPRVSTDGQMSKSSPGNRRSIVNLHKDHRGTAVKAPQDSVMWSKRPNESRSSSTERKSETMSISSLEKILPLILAPSSVWEVMHMLRMLGKHVRKNYMKFKIKFSLIQFHRIIESAVLSFTSLIKYLDLSKICNSVNALQRRLCDVIESNLKQVKKNGIVDRLFEQQQPDMKKKLWKFVDEQLDYLFEKLKKILVKFCGSVNSGSDDNEGNLEKNKERTQHSNCQKRNMDNNKEIQKEKALKSENIVNFKSSLRCEKFEEKHQDHNNTSTSTVKHDVKRDFSTCSDNTKNSECKEQFLEMNCPSTPNPGKNEGNAVEETQAVQHAGARPERSFEILTEQQASSLTFNLVSDAQMGEIFKSLLQGSDLLDTSVNGTEKMEWELKTPEKQLLESLKCESAPACTAEELVSEGASLCPKVMSDDNWSLLSSEKGPSLASGLSLPVHPDVLDENCMFEVSSNIALGKDNVYSSEKSKPCISSILLEDLAVSLTVPSPLKSDGHLSFLKPEALPTSTPEEVISAHFSEDALLEEEDASEQDIHLALESDNSSSKSSCSSWTSRSVAPGFQYHPNLPMHAVIMEKSNDHFIVKIRRAAPSTPPGLKHGMVAEDPRIGKEADVAAEKEPIPFQSAVFKSGENLENSGKNVDNSKPTHEQNSIVQTQVPDIYEFLKDTSSKVVHCEEMVHDCFKLHQGWEPKVSENLQELPSVEKIPHPVDDHLPSAYIDITKDPVTEPKNLGELMEVTVLNIDHLECSGTNLDQDTQIIGSSLQSDTIDAFIDLTHGASNESRNEDSGSVLAVEGVECQVICIDDDSHREGKEVGASHPSECAGKDACIDLTQESPDLCEIKTNTLKSEPLSNLDCLELSGTLDNVHKKRKNSPVLSHSSQKKQRKEMGLTNSEKTKRLSQDSGRNSDAHRKPAIKKREPAGNDTPLLSEASPGLEGSAAALDTSPTSLSAKNVVKKKGVIIVSWTRNDDREILLECQKRMPSLKTFTYLAVKLNKNPNQVSERFQQLKKLFEKSKCR